VVLVGDDPPVFLPAKAGGEAQPVAGIPAELLLGTPAWQSPGEGQVVAGGDVEREDLERPSPRLPLKERRQV
jgi:hypothetical protein